MYTHFSRQMLHPYVRLRSRDLEIVASSDAGHMRLAVQVYPGKSLDKAILQEVMEQAYGDVHLFADPAVQSTPFVVTESYDQDHRTVTAVVARSQLPELCALALATLNRLQDIQKKSSTGQDIPIVDRQVEIDTGSCEERRAETREILTRQLQYARDRDHIDALHRLRLSEWLDIDREHKGIPTQLDGVSVQPAGPDPMVSSPAKK